MTGLALKAPTDLGGSAYPTDGGGSLGNAPRGREPSVCGPILCPDRTAIPAAGVVGSNSRNLTVFLKACMGLKQTPLRKAIARLVETRTPTRLTGTEAALGWFITTAKDEEFVWKTGGSGGCNSFIGFSTRNRRGAIALSNFHWNDQDTINLGMKLIDKDHQPIDFSAYFT